MDNDQQLLFLPSSGRGLTLHPSDCFKKGVYHLHPLSALHENVPFPSRFHHPVLNPIPLSHSLIRFSLRAPFRLTALVLRLSFPCSQTILQPHFPLSFFSPPHPVKTHFDFFSPKPSMPYSPFAPIPSFSSPFLSPLPFPCKLIVCLFLHISLTCPPPFVLFSLT